MATLTGQTIANTYLTLLRLQSATIGADASAKTINDAADTASALSISTTRVGIGETAPNNLLQITHNVTTVVNAANVRDDAIRGITIEMTGNTNNAGSMLKFSGYAGGNVAAIAPRLACCILVRNWRRVRSFRSFIALAVICVICGQMKKHHSRYILFIAKVT